ncbi:MAG: type IV toxin-antitoxin system AbiEi family antitoxin domain-containing protein [Verrucomicrobia bacterium]|nr:type IV toxin-antitoxin system AbiEi family antitoxin domain-containing protein [Verrucomicrobiota bacterium]MDA1085847.1 type IV toxin-antitoxin system AbiEi family antitoxin domain-containing protein [Verrucomicrobiota bacterium]
MQSQQKQRVLRLAERKGVLRPRDLDEYGIPRVYLSRLCKQGLLNRRARGIYGLADTDLGQHETLLQACKRVPRGVICLLSALSFHSIGTQNPHEVWLAVEPKARKPRVGDLPLKIVRFSGDAFVKGVDRVIIDGVDVRVYGVAKTVADCFKYRNKIGLDVAMEALRESRRMRLCTMDDLWCFAKICRVARVMQPYLESVA